MIFLIILTISSSTTTHATCAKSVFLRVGDKVTDCDRIGLSVPQSKNIKKQLIDADYLGREVEGYKKLLDLKKQMYENIREENKALNIERLRAYEERDKQASRNQTVFWVGMGVGIAIPIIAAVIIQKVVK